jgi:hypothetical protein
LLSIVEKVAREPDVLGLIVFDRTNAIFLEMVYSIFRIREYNWRMSRYNELRPSLHEIMHPNEKCELPRRGESGFGFVKGVEPVRTEAMHDESEK